ncbi:endolytic transglycosylase MltG [Synechococcales cyanobacterium C]|uniref:Endolytic murein transglycosylase n=2 Tax=Petrachloros TaxID=2918834 RepID=A0A8K2A2K4_9CYAN|nr:endolytic transglycosylase MltG [Petrachloros mirabilis]NCJ08407.1 endolytic transglycosylase MltG [Petrachloros mirabilis ULC683]
MFLLWLGVGGAWVWWRHQTAPASPATAVPPDAQELYIPEGTSANQIGVILSEAGLIRSSLAWRLWNRWQGLRGAPGGFQAGTYRISPQEPLPVIAQQIWTGDVVETGFTIPEGWTIQQMADYFEAQDFFSAEEFLSATQQVARSQFPWLPADVPILEGFLFPDTYQVPVDQLSPLSVVEIMLERFEQVALPSYENATAPPQLSLLEWVTLSSIVEKEAVIPQERGLIAGVFWNRLRLGMTLGADPTVEYGLGIEQTPDQPLTLAQVNMPSPYNTYLNPGLPPTPIAAPGLASLEAVLNPEDTEYLYFVARYDGSHVFSRTLAEHERAQGRIRDQQDARSDGARS